MTPAEKAKELYNKMAIEFIPVYTLPGQPSDFVTPVNPYTKQCALIAVDEILNQDVGAFDITEREYHFGYWYNVKEELEKI